VFFADMFLTVTHLLHPSFGGWAWTVPAATEGSFTVLYLLDLLLQAKGKPMGWLRFAPYPFAAASLFLNVYAAGGSLPGITGHAVVTVAFFLPLLAGEATVRSLSVSDETMCLAGEIADARRYALDLIRDREGIWWRFKVPSLLKRQILRSRPPAIVAAAVADGARFGGASKWESLVEEWVTAGLTQHARIAAKVERKKRAIEREARPEPVQEARPAAIAAPAPVMPEPVPEPRPQARPKRAAKPALRLPASKSRSMSPEQLAAHVRAMKDEYGSVSINRVKTDLSLGTDKAKLAHQIACPPASGSGAEVVQMGARR
jgi:hypothetical protein